MPSLLDLPAELLDFIVELVHATRPTQYLGAVQRAFLPRARQLVLREVEVGTHKRLEAFHKLSNTAAVSRTVRRLVLDIWSLPGATHLPPDALNAIASLLSRLTSLVHVVSAGSTEVLKLLWNGSVSMQRLQTLDIGDHYTGFTQVGLNSIDASVALERSERFPNLATVRINCILWTASLPAAHFAPEWCSRLNALTFAVTRGEAQRAHAILALLSSTVVLSSLIIDEYGTSHPSLETVLRALPSPTLLRKLSVWQKVFDLLPPACLSRFTGLASLEIPLYRDIPSLLPSLSSLPSLQQLRFWGKPASYAEFQPLPTQPALLPNLKLLVLPAVHRDWPLTPEQRREAQELFDAGRRRGVEIDRLLGLQYGS
ncbi:hypothetical protein JCM10213v2_008603 [Rhodosporidiobolus nylandii]